MIFVCIWSSLIDLNTKWSYCFWSDIVWTLAGDPATQQSIDLIQLCPAFSHLCSFPPIPSLFMYSVQQKSEGKYYMY